MKIDYMGTLNIRLYQFNRCFRCAFIWYITQWLHLFRLYNLNHILQIRLNATYNNESKHPSTQYWFWKQKHLLTLVSVFRQYHLTCLLAFCISLCVNVSIGCYTEREGCAVEHTCDYWFPSELWL